MDTIRQLIPKPPKKGDVLLVLIGIEKDLKIAFTQYLLLCRINAFISVILIVLTVMSLLFYENKGHHHALSVMSLLTIVAMACVELSQQRKNRWFLFVGLFFNALFVWIFIIYLTSLIFIGELC